MGPAQQLPHRPQAQAAAIDVPALPEDLQDGATSSISTTDDDPESLNTETMPRPWLHRDPQSLVGPIADKLTVLLEDVVQYKRLLAHRGSDAQHLLDSFQWLLGFPELDNSFKRSLIVATQRLSAKSGLYPTCYSLRDVEPIGDHPLVMGSFADIYRGSFQGHAVCMKVIRLYQSSQTDDFLKHFSKEAILWGQLSHPNLLPIYGLYRFGHQICLVSPWMENGDISNYLKDYPSADRVLLALDVAEGLRYLHENSIIHGDLKGPNILVNQLGRACLADFGLSSVSDVNILAWTSHSSTGSKGGSLRWQAPELFDLENDELVHNSTASDVYAWSCVSYEIFTGNIPFAQLSRDATVMLQIKIGARPARPSDSSLPWSAWGLTDDIWALMEDCWRANPDDRPGIDEVIARLSYNQHLDDRPAGDEDTLSSIHFRTKMSDIPDRQSVAVLERLLNPDGNSTLSPSIQALVLTSTPALTPLPAFLDTPPHTPVPLPNEQAGSLLFDPLPVPDLPRPATPWGPFPGFLPGQSLSGPAHAPAHATLDAYPRDPLTPPPAPIWMGSSSLFGLSRHYYDRMGPFAAGKDYGPVLDPFVIRFVGVRPILNPLLRAWSEGDASHPELKWNMLFNSSHCQRSTDTRGVPWPVVRDEPATFPRISSLNIVSKTFPWMVKVHARDESVGVTCGEVIESLSSDFQRLVFRTEYEALTPRKRRLVDKAYHFNRSRSKSASGALLEPAMRRLDFVGEYVAFGGIYRDEEIVRSIIRTVPPCTFVLKCMRLSETAEVQGHGTGGDTTMEA